MSKVHMIMSVLRLEWSSHIRSLLWETKLKSKHKYGTLVSYYYLLTSTSIHSWFREIPFYNNRSLPFRPGCSAPLRHLLRRLLQELSLLVGEHTHVRRWQRSDRTSGEQDWCAACESSEEGGAEGVGWEVRKGEWVGVRGGIKCAQ